MTGKGIMSALVKRLGHLFSGYTLLNKKDIPQEVKIFQQYLPQPSGITITQNGGNNTPLKNYSESDYDLNFPCIVIKLGETVFQEERRADMCRTSVKLVIGIYDAEPDCQGYLDILNIQERISGDFLVNRIFNSKYHLDMPVKSRLLEAETWPVYFGEMEFVFTSGRPHMTHEFAFIPNSPMDAVRG